MIWPILVLVLCLVLLVAVVGVALAQYARVQKYTNAVAAAWNPSGTEADYAAMVRPNPPRLHTGDHMAAADAVVRMQHKTRIEVAAPPHASLVTVLGPEKSKDPYMCGMFRDDDTLCIAFRGTMTASEKEADLEMTQVPFYGGMLVHRGFYRLYRKYRGLIVQTVLSRRWKSVIVTGHSLGGALATLLTVDLTDRLSVPARVVGVTFGSPRVGNEALAQRVSDKCELYRYANTVDIVASLPLPLMPNFEDHKGELFIYKHGGTAREFTAHHDSWKNNHLMSTYMDYLASMEAEARTHVATS